MAIEIKDAIEAFEIAEEFESENRNLMDEDYRFARLGEQWPEEIAARRRRARRPMLTLNRLPSFIRQVVNEARQNKPTIQVKPADSGADPVTAQILAGLIRHIEARSMADAAYDTALEMAVSTGVGYVRVRNKYTCEDSFEMELVVDRVFNPFSIYRDPSSTAVDSSDWDSAFVVEEMTHKRFESEYPNAEIVNFERGRGQSESANDWFSDKEIRLAEYWTREKVKTILLRLSNGAAMLEDGYLLRKDEYDAVGIFPTEVKRDAMTYRVVQRIMTGKEILETNEWPGKYIPIIPCFGEEVLKDGRRWLLPLIHFARDPQLQHNYWATSAAEKIALETKAPWVGPKGFAATDNERWMTANTENHPYLEYDGNTPPARQFSQGVPAADMQMALASSDEMKAVLGLYDASLGARSNETSGIAINARQRQGGVSTFHFPDNQSRCVAHTGRVLVDLISKTMTGPRIERILGEDGSPDAVAINQQVIVNGQTTIFDVTTGAYDVTVSSGPTFGTRREQAASQMMELVRSFPQAAPIIGDLVAKNLDWPGADEISRRWQRTMLPPQLTEEDGEEEIPPEVRAALEEKDRIIEEGKAMLDQMQAKIADLESRAKTDDLKSQVDQLKLEVEKKKLEIEAFKARTERIDVEMHLQEEKDLSGVRAALGAIEMRMQSAVNTSSRGKIIKMPDGTYVSEKVVTGVTQDGAPVTQTQRLRATPLGDGSWDVVAETGSA